VKLLLIDDHSIMRAGLAALLTQTRADIEILEAGDAAGGIREVDAHDDLDAVFLDLNMPGEDGMSALREIGKRRPDLPVILLSSSENPEHVRQALAAGALGYLPKSASPQTLISALQLVLSGEVYVPQIMLRTDASQASDRPPTAMINFSAPLTERQIEAARPRHLQQGDRPRVAGFRTHRESACHCDLQIARCRQPDAGRRGCPARRPYLEGRVWHSIANFALWWPANSNPLP